MRERWGGIERYRNKEESRKIEIEIDIGRREYREIERGIYSER